MQQTQEIQRNMRPAWKPFARGTSTLRGPVIGGPGPSLRKADCRESV